MIYRIILFTILINWSISMQILNQSSSDKRTSVIATAIALLGSSAAALILLI